MIKKTMLINGTERRVVAAPGATLHEALRRQMFLTGVKAGCRAGACGACAVIVDGAAVKSCQTLVRDLKEGAEVETIEGLGDAGGLHPLQAAWVARGAPGGGLRAPGLILAAKALLDKDPAPSREAMEEALRAVAGGGAGEPALSEAAGAALDGARLLRGEATLAELWQDARGERYQAGAELADAAAVAAVTGAQDFGQDLWLRMPEGALYVAPVPAGAAAAAPFSVDAAEAARLPGVLRVITAGDVPGSNRLGGSRRILEDRAAEGPGGAVAAVLAFSPAPAREAARLVKVRGGGGGAGGAAGGPGGGAAQAAQGAPGAGAPVADSVEAAARRFEQAVRKCAKEIRDKYVNPPRTTDFAILFVPTEGLYAEILRRPGLFEQLAREMKVTCVGPANLAAFLNSLQMGFRTLAIEKRSSEAWELLGAVKAEFGRFGDALDKTRKKLEEAAGAIDQAGARSRAIEKRLRAVESPVLPGGGAPGAERPVLPGGVAPGAGGGADDAIDAGGAGAVAAEGEG
jgi:aerobic-type carbon monoxide dehydrogenase small subunit (CoxS/CutS family)